MFFSGRFNICTTPWESRSTCTLTALISCTTLSARFAGQNLYRFRIHNDWKMIANSGPKRTIVICKNNTSSPLSPNFDTATWRWQALFLSLDSFPLLHMSSYCGYYFMWPLFSFHSSPHSLPTKGHKLLAPLSPSLRRTPWQTIPVASRLEHSGSPSS